MKVEAKQTVVQEVKKQETNSLPTTTRVDEKLMPAGKYEVTSETRFTIPLYLKKSENGRWQVMVKDGKDIEAHKLVFRMWTYDEMIGMKKLVTKYEAEKRIHVVDHDSLNQLKIQKFLISWTLDRENSRLKLFHVNGVLADESWDTFRMLQPNIISYILDEMNSVLDNNG